MSLFLLRTPAAATTTTTTISCSYSKPPHKKPQQQQFHFPLARDRVIDFGRHKGKPLGSLPSTYLKWVSKNLRARDFQHWAELADQVLHDPIYNDRIEWELAENLLTGNMNINSFASSAGNGSDESAAAQLAEMSERFGWDNDDKMGWSKVDFQLLGTSNGGRIPRKVEGKMGKEELKMVDEEKKMKEKRRELSESEERRRERRMRRVRDKMGIRGNSRDSFGNGQDDHHNGDRDDDGDDQDLTVEIKSRFPGREALLKKVLRSNSRDSFGNGQDDHHNGDRDDDGDDQDLTVEIKSRFPGREALLKKVLRSKRFL